MQDCDEMGEGLHVNVLCQLCLLRGGCAPARETSDGYVFLRNIQGRIKRMTAHAGGRGERFNFKA